MVSNTKLSDIEKKVLAAMRDGQKNVNIVNDGKTTIAYRQFPTTVEFSTSVSSGTEKKFRNKVGEYFARARMDNGETVKMDTLDFFAMLEIVYFITEFNYENV